MSKKVLFVAGLALLLVAAALVAWDLNSPAKVSAQDGECPQSTPCPTGIVEAWSGSAHADAESEPFRHWDSSDPKAVPTSCARCHSEGGYLDYLGADGTAAGVVDNAASVDSVISCNVCHDPAASALTSVTFPSGVEITGLDESARCMVCHQGRESGLSVANAITTVGVGIDEVSADLGFINIHYFAAAASLFGSEVHPAYEYDGQSYMGKFLHVPGIDSCAQCHDPHSLQVKVNVCSTCHTNVASEEDLRSIRMNGSLSDYNGNGDVTEGLYAELQGLQSQLMDAMVAYSNDVVGQAIVYDAASYPYFFADANANGAVDEGETKYISFTPRLLEAAYNYQAYQKDPGAFAHNGKYWAQVLYDSIASLNEALMTPVDMSADHRNPPGHFDATAEAFRHWDEEGEIPASCSKCHSAEGLPFLIKNGVTIGFEPAAALQCSTCHDSMPEFTRYQVEQVTFPSGAVLGFENSMDANLCINCHQGRESTVSVNAAIASAGVGDDEVSDKLRFRNVHYFAAGASLFGSEAQGMYQYEGKDYAGRFAHVPGFDNCTACHDVHQLTIQFDKCTMCHVGVTDVDEIRMATGDLDGQNGTEGGVEGEIMGMEDALLVAIQNYATNTVGTSIAYNSGSYPYFFTDANGNGMVDEGEADAYATWTPRLLRAAYNYQYVQKDPGTFAHNAKYVGQVLYDSIEDIGGADAVAGMTRP